MLLENLSPFIFFVIIAVFVSLVGRIENKFFLRRVNNLDVSKKFTIHKDYKYVFVSVLKSLIILIVTFVVMNIFSGLIKDIYNFSFNIGIIVAASLLLATLFLLIDVYYLFSVELISFSPEGVHFDNNFILWNEIRSITPQEGFNFSKNGGIFFLKALEFATNSKGDFKVLFKDNNLPYDGFVVSDNNPIIPFMNVILGKKIIIKRKDGSINYMLINIIKKYMDQYGVNVVLKDIKLPETTEGSGLIMRNEKIVKNINK